MQTLTYKVNFAPEGIPTTVRLSQNENGRSLQFVFIGDRITIPNGSVVTISGTKPDGHVYSAEGTLDGEVATFDEEIQMTAAAGEWAAKLKVTHSGLTVATQRLWMIIDADTVLPGSVPSESELDGLVAEAQQYAENARSAAYGSPLTAALEADMLDTSRVYVYTGSETGMIFGHWYYYEDGAWEDGGVYQSQGVQTDTTLSIPGMPADAGAAGDALAGKVNAEVGKGLSSNDFTTAEKTKLAGIADQATRVLVDNTLKQSGQAADSKIVGDEIDGLKEDLSELEEDIASFTGNKRYTNWARNKWVKNTAPTTQVNESGWESIVIECNPGDVFSVKGYGGASPRLWMFSDSQATLLASAEVSAHAYDYLVITAPANAKYLAVNSQYANLRGDLVFGKVISNEFDAVEESYIASGFNQLIVDGNFTHGDGWKADGSTSWVVSATDNVLTATVKSASMKLRRNVLKDFPHIIAGHKYYVNVEYYGSDFGTVKETVGNKSIVGATTANTWNKISGVIEPTSISNNVADCQFEVTLVNNYTVTEINVRNYWVTDLTAMFGKGNEPEASVFSSLYNDAYYPTLGVVRDYRSVNYLSEGRIKAIKDYATPEMYGAVGDGETDDSQAIQDALNSGKPVRFLGVYAVGNTINIPDNGYIYGQRGHSVIIPTCATVFHLSKYNVLSDFDVHIFSANVLTVFEIDPDSGNSMLVDTIRGINVRYRRDVAEDDFTVCHFHAENMNHLGIYNVIVEGCTFDCNELGGYVARVYSDSDSWMSTIIFTNNYSRNFKWHYFFADDDTNVSGTVGKCLVSNCVAQSNADTNGFVFIANDNAVSLINNVTWDWGSTTNCPDRPYVFKEQSIVNSYQQITAQQPFTSGNIIFYNGTTFTANPHRRADIAHKLNGQYNHQLIPKLIGIGNAYCVQLNHRTTSLPSTETMIRFYLADRYGIAEVCISPHANKVYVSRPIIVKIATLNNRTFYIHSNGSKLYIETAIITIPSNNSLDNIALSENTLDRVQTADCADNFDTSFLEELPEGAVDMSIVIQRGLYVTGENGTNYYLTVDTSGNIVARSSGLYENQLT